MLSDPVSPAIDGLAASSTGRRTGVPHALLTGRAELRQPSRCNSATAVPVKGSPYGTAPITLNPAAGLVAGDTIVAMTDDGMDQTDPPSPKVIAALLREARSVSRRADKLSADIAAVPDPMIQQLAAQANDSIEQLVHHLMRLEQQAQRTRRAAGHLAP